MPFNFWPVLVKVAKSRFFWGKSHDATRCLVNIESENALMGKLRARWPRRTIGRVMMFAHVEVSMNQFRRRPVPVLAILLVSLLSPVLAQSGPAPGANASASPTPAPTESLRPALSQVGEAIAGLNVPRWKAPSEVRTVTQRDIDSIQHDLTSTLPPLLEKANTPPASVASYFAVYRNIDALYDVLLRVSETAVLAGSQNDATTTQAALSSLETARRNLGDAILAVADSHEQELGSLRAAEAARASAAAAAPAPATKTVVDDGPETPAKKPSTKKTKKKPAPPPSTAPAASPQ